MRRTAHIFLLPLAGSLALAIGLLAPAVVIAQEAEKESVEGARETLSDGAYPWYDIEKDQLQPLEFEAESSFKLPDWLLWGGDFFKVLVYGALGLLLAALIVALIMYAKNRQPAPVQVRAAREEMTKADQVDALPFLAERPRGDLLGQARRHYEQGNYSEAIIYLFSYQLLELDKFSFIQLAKGKTNRQYLREASRVAPLRSPLERTLLTFEGVFFGSQSLDRAGFEACWNELPRFEQLVRGAT
jgi:hypothetical protein